MARAVRWPQELRVAIDAADDAKLPPSRVYAMAKDGTLDGLTRPYPDLPSSTFWAILKSVRRQREAAEDPVTPGDELAAANTIIRRSLEIAKREQRYADQQVKAAQTASDKGSWLKVLSVTTNMVASYKKQVEPRAPRSSKSIDRAQTASTQSRKTSPIDDLIRQARNQVGAASP